MWFGWNACIGASSAPFIRSSANSCGVRTSIRDDPVFAECGCHFGWRPVFKGAVFRVFDVHIDLLNSHRLGRSLAACTVSKRGLSADDVLENEANSLNRLASIHGGRDRTFVEVIQLTPNRHTLRQ